MTGRERLQIDDADLGCDELEIVADDKGFRITVEEPWAGDTETGFGQSCSIRLTTDNALKLAKWIAVQVEKRQDN
jgi:hypothetical protein